MTRYRVEVKAFICVIVDTDDAAQAREPTDHFVAWLSPTIEQIDDYTGPFGIDSESSVAEINE